MNKNLISSKFCTPIISNNNISKCISVSSNAKDSCVKVSSTSESILIKSDIIRLQKVISSIPILKVYEITSYKMILDNIKYVERNDKIKIKIMNYNRSNKYLKLSTNILSSQVSLKENNVLLSIGNDALDGEIAYVELTSTELGKKESELGYSEEFILKMKSRKPILKPMFSGILYEYDDIKYEIIGNIKYERIESLVFSTSSNTNKGFASLKDNIITVRLPYSSNSISDNVFISITFFERNRYGSDPFDTSLKIIAKNSSGTKIISTVNIGTEFESSSDYNQVFYTDKTYINSISNYGSYKIIGMQKSKYKQSNKFEIIGMRKEYVYKFFFIESLFDLYKAVNIGDNEVSYNQAIMPFTHEKYRNLSLIVFDVTNNVYSICGLYIGLLNLNYQDTRIREMFTHEYSIYALQYIIQIVNDDTMSISFSASGYADNNIKNHIYFDNNVKVVSSRAIYKVTGVDGLYNIEISRKKIENVGNIIRTRTYILHNKVVEFPIYYTSSIGYWKVELLEFGFIQSILTKYVLADKSSFYVNSLAAQTYINSSINEVEEISDYTDYIYDTIYPYYVPILVAADTSYDYIYTISILSATFNNVAIDITKLQPLNNTVIYSDFDKETLPSILSSLSIEYGYWTLISTAHTNTDGVVYYTDDPYYYTITLNNTIIGTASPLHIISIEDVIIPIDLLNDSVLLGAYSNDAGLIVLPNATYLDLYTKHKLSYHTNILKD